MHIHSHVFTHGIPKGYNHRLLPCLMVTNMDQFLAFPDSKILSFGVLSKPIMWLLFRSAAMHKKQDDSRFDEYSTIRIWSSKQKKALKFWENSILDDKIANLIP